MARLFTLQEQLEKMRQEWDERARENARHYVSTEKHDWEDEDSVRILRVCRDAMRANATLLVLEWDLGPPNAVAGPKFSDLNMLVAPGGRERTVDEYRALFEAAGFSLEGVVPDATGRFVLEGKPA